MPRHPPSCSLRALATACLVHLPLAMHAGPPPLPAAAAATRGGCQAQGCRRGRRRFAPVRIADFAPPVLLMLAFCSAVPSKHFSCSCPSAIRPPCLLSLSASVLSCPAACAGPSAAPNTQHAHFHHPPAILQGGRPSTGLPSPRSFHATSRMRQRPARARRALSRTPFASPPCSDGDTTHTHSAPLAKLAAPHQTNKLCCCRKIAVRSRQKRAGTPEGSRGARVISSRCWLAGAGRARAVGDPAA